MATVLTVDQVREIKRQIRQRECARTELSNAAIAGRFGVHQRTIDHISSGKSWRHVRVDGESGDAD